jgi:hypothetical protein
MMCKPNEHRLYFRFSLPFANHLYNILSLPVSKPILFTEWVLSFDLETGSQDPRNSQESCFQQMGDAASTTYNCTQRCFHVWQNLTLAILDCLCILVFIDSEEK